MNTVVRFVGVPSERVDEIKEDIRVYSYPEDVRWADRPHKSYSVGLSSNHDFDEHFAEVVSELSKLGTMIKKWQDSVETIYVDVGIFLIDKPLGEGKPMGICEFPVKDELIKFCCENKIGITLVFYGAHLQE